MLDVSIRLGRAQPAAGPQGGGRGWPLLYITHDIASARYFADETLVMYAGPDGRGRPQRDGHPAAQASLHPAAALRRARPGPAASATANGSRTAGARRDSKPDRRRPAAAASIRAARTPCQSAASAFPAAPISVAATGPTAGSTAAATAQRAPNTPLRRQPRPARAERAAPRSGHRHPRPRMPPSDEPILDCQTVCAESLKMLGVVRDEDPPCHKRRSAD